MKNNILGITKGLLSAFVATVILASAGFLPTDKNAGVHIAGGLSVRVSAYTSGNLIYSVSNGKATITGCSNQNIEELTIPSKINGYPVVGIDDNAFWRRSEPGFPDPNETLLGISIPATVTSIPDMTFHYCVSLVKINVDSSNQYYSSINGVLYNKAKTRLICYPSGNSAKVFNIPDSLKTIPETAFNEWCINFTDFVVKSTNTAFCSKDGVLFNKAGTVLIKYPSCNTRKMYYMPEGVKTISSLSFEKCKYLQNVRFSSTVETIKDMAFNCCYLIKGMLIPRNVKSIEFGALEIAYGYGSGGYDISVYGFKVYCFKNTEGERYAREMSDCGVQCIIVTEPASVGALKAASASYNSIKITWSAVSGATGYLVYRYNTSTKKYERIQTTTASSFTDSPLTTGKTYYYKVVAYKTVNGINIYSAASAAVSAKPLPATPTNFKAVGYTSTSIKLTWDPVTGASGYVIYKYNSISKTWDRLRVQATTSYINTGLTTGVTCYYKVRAYRMVNNSPVYGNPTEAVSVLL